MSATQRFQKWLVKAREKAKLSYAQLAEKSGVSSGAIHSIEHGGGSPSLDTADKLCRALGGEIELRSRPKHGPLKRNTAYLSGYTSPEDYG
jgi:transcriptional regulator with XRE-family HTH domain